MAEIYNMQREKITESYEQKLMPEHIPAHSIGHALIATYQTLVHLNALAEQYPVEMAHQITNLVFLHNQLTETLEIANEAFNLD